MVTVGVAAFVLAPLDLPEITIDGAAAALSVGNIRFAFEATDYFGPTTPSPFRHFWSLGVEEQFYLLWPALMILALARGGSRRRVALVIGGVVAASFAASFWLTGVDQAWAFYSFPTRAWQLGLGGLLAATASWFARRSGLLLEFYRVAGGRRAHRRRRAPRRFDALPWTALRSCRRSPRPPLSSAETGGVPRAGC